MQYFSRKGVTILRNHDIKVSRIKQVPICIDDKLHKQLKIIAIQNGTTIQKIVEDFLKKYVEDHRK